MLGRATARRAALGKRCCCACGYNGRFAQVGPDRARESGAHCPRCGCDFSERPPRSYAEMEGIDLNPGAATDPARGRPDLEARFVERWLAFVFVLLLALALAIGLLSELISPIAGRL
jgi:hypothetical protein